jgi:hypothetical protein
MMPSVISTYCCSLSRSVSRKSSAGSPAWSRIAAPRKTKGKHDIRENVGDLVPHREQDDDHHDRHENQDQGVLDHALPGMPARAKAGENAKRGEGSRDALLNPNHSVRPG